jgi:metal-responsive CopG/Arc/MetJ family transcriptional regulator
MPISIHLPDRLVLRVDARARRLGLSRSGYIATVLERELTAGGGWSDGFFERLRAVSEEDASAAAEAFQDLTAHRKSRKKAPRL